LEELKLEVTTHPIPPVSRDEATTDDDTSALLKFIEHAPIDVDRLVARSGWSVDRVSVALTLLELDGRVEALSGGVWARRG
jgi:DNA processing protein